MPLPKHQPAYTYLDYQSWPENERWEIFDGTAHMQAVPSRQHQDVLMALSSAIYQYLKDKPCKVYPAPFCVRLDAAMSDQDTSTVVEPDISVICDPNKLNDRGCIGAPDMIIEIVSPSTAKVDKLLKFNKYEAAGVRAYWIVEPDQKLISVFRLLDGRYGRPEIFTRDDMIQVSIFSDFEIDLRGIFPE